MIENTTWRRVRVLAAGSILVLLPLALVAALAIAPIWTDVLQAKNDTFLARRFKILISEKPLVQAAVTRDRKLLSESDLFCTGTTAELAGAQLQNVLENLVRQIGGQIQSSDLEVPQTQQSLKMIAATISITLPSDRLPTLLAEIDVQKPYLFVDAADIRSAFAGNDNGLLQIQMQVSCFTGMP